MNIKIGGWAAAVVVLLGSFLPWASVSAFGVSQSVNGTEADGKRTLLAALAMGVLFWLWNRRTVIAAGAVSAIAAVIGIANLIDINGVAGDLGGLVDVSAGIGIFMVILGGIAGAVMGFMGQASIAANPASAGTFDSRQAIAWVQARTGQAPAQGQAPAPAPGQPLAPAATAAAGWLPDPQGKARLRYWDGAAWTEHTQD